VLVMKSYGYDFPSALQWAKINVENGSYKIKNLESRIIYIDKNWVYLAEEEGVRKVAREKIGF